MKTPRVASDILKDAALQQMAENGMELSKVATGRS